MLNLKLFTDLQGDTTASLLLKPSSPGKLQFFVISTSVNYSIVVTGECDGELPTESPLSFDVVLSTIAPLINKNYQFRLSYVGSILRFVEVNDKFSISPLCVEHISDFSLDIAKRYLNFSDALSEYEDNRAEYEKVSSDLSKLREEYDRVKTLSLSGGPSSDPWGDPSDVWKDNSIDDHYKPLIADMSKKVLDFESKFSGIREISMQEFKRIAVIATRANTVVSMCDDFAVVNLSTAFVVQKVKCGARSVQGKLLRRLIYEPDGRFYEYNGDLVFLGASGKESNKSVTAVFINSYLPNVEVNSSIVTKGAVKEKYTLNLHGMLQVVSTVLGKFDTMVFDMGSSYLQLSNDRGEQLIYKFEVEDAKTIELNKAMRGESAGEITMSAVEIPKVVQRILPQLEDRFTVYVKDRKIILQFGTLYVVFSK